MGQTLSEPVVEKVSPTHFSIACDPCPSPAHFVKARAFSEPLGSPATVLSPSRLTRPLPLAGLEVYPTRVILPVGRAVAEITKRDGRREPAMRGPADSEGPNRRWAGTSRESFDRYDDGFPDHNYDVLN